MSESTALTVPEQGGYLALMPSNSDGVMAIINANIDGGLQPYELPAIKGPSGDSKVFTIPTIDGDVTNEAFEGVMVAMKAAHSFYATSFEDSGGGTAPDCSSRMITDDKSVRSEIGFVGGDFDVGDYAEKTGLYVGGECVTCPLNQFGEDGSVPPCTEYKVLYILMAGTTMPLQFKVTPTGLKNLRKFLVGRSAFGEGYNQMVVQFSLEKDRSQGGIVFYRLAEPVRVRPLNEDEQKQVFTLASRIQPWLDRQEVRRSKETEFDDVPAGEE